MTEKDTHKANVLYVDDLQTNLILFQATFERDYHIILAESPEKALEILRKEDIQVLVTDQRMPEMTGTELLEIVAEEFPEIRRFLLTAYTDFETVVEAVNKGHIHGYINKPIQADDVRASINSALEVYYLREKNKEIMSELEKANTELLNMDNVKSEILRLITREIRTPLNRIMGTIHLLKDKIDSDELIDVINILDTSVQKLERFSGMVEQISVINSREHSFEAEEISLKQLIEYTLVESSGRINESDAQITVGESADTVVKGDFDLLISGLSMVIDHILNHTVSGTSVEITSLLIGDCPACRISYQGEHYSEKRLKELETHYSPEGKQMNLRLGIELALAQLIMQAHEGYLQFTGGGDQPVNIILIFGNCSVEAHE